MKRILKYVKKYLLRISFGLTIKIVGTLFDLIIPYILSYIIDDVVPLKNNMLVLKYGVIMLLSAICCFLFNVIANQMAAKVAMKVTKDVRKDLFNKILSLSSRQCDEVSIPSLVSRMTTDTYNIHHMVGMMQRIGVRAPILMIGGICITLTINKPMTLVLLALLPILGVLSVLMSKLGVPIYAKLQLAIDDLVRSIRENISGIRVIKALSKEKEEKEKYDKVNKKVIDLELKSGYLMARISPIMNVLLNVGLVVVIIIGAYQVNEGNLLPGKVLAFTTYFSFILNAMLTITRIFVILTRSAASASRIDYVMNLKEDLEVEDIEIDENITSHIYFENVDFSYNKKELNIENISFSLNKGQSIGIIGPTGSGKTTLINLLMRFYDVDNGRILINGRNIKSINPKELKKMFGVVFQNDMLFSNTIRENIDFGRNLTDEQIDNAAKYAQAKSFIENQPNGYETVLASKGTNLSGGQRQRVLIARALAGNPEILILDDSSSALDYKTDAALRKEIRDNFKDITQIIVTQRVSTAMHCDYVLMIDEGRELAFGTHEELLENNEDYQNLNKIQMGGGLNE